MVAAKAHEPLVTVRRRDMAVAQRAQRRTSTTCSVCQLTIWVASHADSTCATIGRPSQPASV